MRVQLHEQHVAFAFVDAVDGDDPASLPAADVERYFSGRRLELVRNGAGNARHKAAYIYVT
jgi:hypothetical protein